MIRALAIGFLIGALAVQGLSVLPAWWWSLTVLPPCALLAWRWPRASLLLGLVLGFSWTVLRAGAMLEQRLPHELEGSEIRVSGVVVDLPERTPDALRFDFAVAQSSAADGVPLDWRGKLRLAWYDAQVRAEPGEHLDLVVRLKRPRGVANPGGFDFEAYALERRLAATGYVRTLVSRESRGHGIDALRARYSQWIAATLGSRPAAGLLRGLTVGDQAAIDDRDWDNFRTTGTAHLVAISGFHIGIVAGLGVLLTRLLYRWRPQWGLRLPRRNAEALAATVWALAYSLLAGWSLPVLRTLIMIAVIALAQTARRRLTAATALALALLSVLLFDPLAVLAPGFWLSFVGVAWLLFCFSGRAASDRMLESFGRAQWVSAIGLLPLAVCFFSQATWVGPLANLIAIPLVSLILVPASLLVFGLWCLWAPLAAAPLPLLAWCADGLLAVLDRLAHWPYASVPLPAPGLLSVAAALLGAAVLLLPRPLPGRALGALLFLPLLFPRQVEAPPQSLQIRVVDVGQGLSVFLRTAHHALLFDAGPFYRGGLDMGEAAVVPALRSLGVRRLDRLVLSHGDNDHIGGAPSVIAAFQPGQIQQGGGKSSYPRCVAGEHWQWDGVDFAYLHPPAEFPDLGNDTSCVLRVAVGTHAVLLPGDASALIESRLLRDAAAQLPAELLIAPHHGSRSASSAEFLAVVKPRFVAFSAGYRSRFGHPAADVVARYEQVGTLTAESAKFGMTSFVLDPQGVRLSGRERIDHPHYWSD